MFRLWWLAALLAGLAVAGADPVDETEDLVDVEYSYTTKVRKSPKKKKDVFMLETSAWFECKQIEDPNDVKIRTIDKIPEHLLYVPKLGRQSRKTRCWKNGRASLDPHCGTNQKVDKWRMCVVEEDCKLGQWFAWSTLMSPGGTSKRRRRIEQLPQGGGQGCGVVEEIEPQELEPTAHWVPGAWGQCVVAVDSATSVRPSSSMDDDPDSDAIYEDSDDDDEAEEYQDDMNSKISTCGGGIQRREAKCVRSSGQELDATNCAHVPMPTLVQPCEVPCPRDCEVGEWSEWSPCQPTDGCPLYPVQQLTTTGYSVRRRRVTAAASGGGASCPPLEEKRTCAAPRCASWKPLPWGSCELVEPHSACGPGRRTRELNCVGHDGQLAQKVWCSGTGAPPRTERCRIACAGDCVVSFWGPWSPCSATCAAPGSPPPTRTRHRHIISHASPTGWPCPSAEQLVQHETCNTHACATYSWLATPWGPCQKRTGDYVPASNYTDFLDGDTYDTYGSSPCVQEGQMTRDVMCVQNNVDIVRDAVCSPLKRPASRRACTIRCQNSCQVDAWSAWSECDKDNCVQKQYRVRNVRGGPNCGAIQQERSCPLAKKCSRDLEPEIHTTTPRWFASGWSDCMLVPENKCGNGFRKRSIWCGTQSHRMEFSFCAGQLVPHSLMPCQVPCDDKKPAKNLTCSNVCANPLRYVDAVDVDNKIPNCTCKTVTLEILPADSDCILPNGTECGEGRTLRAARCIVDGIDVPMAVCRKYHSLTGPNRVSEPSTDGLSYDEEFPDLLSGACSVRCAKDCTVGPWGEWGPCAAEAGSLAAFRFRTREVIEEGTGGGRECGATLQRSTCALSAPRWVAGEWSVCAPQHALCGRAIINRTVTCIDSEGKVLEASSCQNSGPAPAQEAACRAPCPSDCVVSGWSDWSPCEQSKWGGRRDRTRLVLRPASEGGAECPPLVEVEPCASHAHSWHVAPWDDCQPLGGSPCGEGIKKRSVRCLRSDGVFVNDSFCPNTTAKETRESWCYVPCGVDCELSEWSKWDTSACFCGDSSAVRHMRRSRERKIPAIWPGRACAPVEQKAPCARFPCMKLVSKPLTRCAVMLPNGEPLSNGCGAGATLSQSRCQLTTAEGEPLGEALLDSWRCGLGLPGRVIMPEVSVREEPCKLACECSDDEDDDENSWVGPWMEWSPCRGGARSRSRKQLIAPKSGCQPHKYVTIQWANCTEEAVAGLQLHEEKTRRAWVDHEIYHDGYVEGSSSLLAVVWTATIILSFYGVYILYRGILSCLRSKKMKSIAKV